MLNNGNILQVFLGILNYYQIYIPIIHNVGISLNGLLKKIPKWCWTDKCQKAFGQLKVS